MSDEPETVWILPRPYGGIRLAHTDPDCHQLASSDNQPVEKARNKVPNHDICSFCTGDVEWHAGGWERAAGRDAAVLEALREADEPLTRRDIEFEAHLSKGPTQRALRELRDAGRVETVPGDDARKTYYQLTDAEPVIQRPVQRAQVEPFATGLATLFSGLVLAFGWAIATGVIV